MSEAPVCIGIIGTGFGATVQLPGFLAIPEARVIGIVGRHPKRSEELQKKFALPRAFGSPEELIASPDIQLVSISSPSDTHETFTRLAIAAGKAVLCEKPFTQNAAQAESLYKEAEKAGIIHAVDFEFRELRAWQMLKARFDSGSIGKIQSAELQWLVGSWADPKRPWAWQAQKEMGGGILGALGVHLFDAAEWLVGPMSSLTAKAGTTIKERPDPVTRQMKPVTSEDHATVDMKTASGVPVRLALTNVDPKGTGMSILLTGEKGTLVLESTSKEYGRGLRVKETLEGESSVFYEAPNPPDGVDARIPPFQSLAARLIAAIQKGDRGFRPSFIEGVRSQWFLEGVRQSNETGKTSTLPSL